MRFRRRRRIVSAGADNSTQLLSLSLFIMLLAFFIVLNSISSFEDEKITHIMGSIEKTFSTRIQNIPFKKPSIHPEAAESTGEGRHRALDDLEELFRSTIASLQIEINYETGTMWVRVPYEQLNTAIIAAAQPVTLNQGEENEEEVFFLPTLVSLLNTGQGRQSYRMDMLLNMDDNPVSLKLDQPSVFRSSRDRIGKFSRVLQEAGLPPLQMSIGLISGEADMVDLVFRPYQPVDILEDGAPESEAEPPAGGVL